MLDLLLLLSLALTHSSDSSFSRSNSRSRSRSFARRDSRIRSCASSSSCSRFGTVCTSGVKYCQTVRGRQLTASAILRLSSPLSENGSNFSGDFGETVSSSLDKGTCSGDGSENRLSVGASDAPLAIGDPKPADNLRTIGCGESRER